MLYFWFFKTPYSGSYVQMVPIVLSAKKYWFWKIAIQQKRGLKEPYLEKPLMAAGQVPQPIYYY